jgi:hypothetical protein
MKREGIPPAFQPAPYELADLTAVQAVADGRASAEQQKRAMRWIVEKACDAYGLGWHPESAHAASFCSGRRFAGLQIVKAINLNTAVLRKAEHAS